MLYLRLLLSFLIIFNIYAEVEFLDSTFGPNATGIVTSNIHKDSSINDTGLDNLGNIIVAGNTLINDTTNIIVARYDSSGNLDTSFNSIGYNTFISGSQSLANAVAVDASNKVVVGGNDGSNNILLLRYTTAGALDTTFGSGGIATLSIGDGSSTNAIVIDANGKIVVTGISVINGQINLFIARFNADGTLDTGFGPNDGYNAIIANAFYKGNDVAIDLNAKLVVVGSASTLNGSDFLVARFDTNGELDTSFNSTGIVTTNIGGNNQSEARTVSIDSSDRIIASGFTTDDLSGNNSMAVVRYNNDGTLDTSFGVNSTGIVTDSAISQVFDSLIDLDGNIVVGGVFDGSFAVGRYTSNGSLDADFGTNGVVITTINNGSQINSVSLQTDGKVVAGGLEVENLASLGSQFALTRYNKNNIDFINVTSITNNSVITTKAPVISGISSEPNQSVQVLIDGVLVQTVPTDGSGNWTSTPSSLSIGAHRLQVNLIVNSVILVSQAINFTILDIVGEDTIFAYSTNTQTTTTANSFQTVTFNNIRGNNPNIWSTPNNTTLKYLSPLTGKFFVIYTAEAGILNAVLALNFNVSARVLKNGTEIAGTQANTQISVGIASSATQLLVNSNIITLAQNDTVQLQYAINTNNAAGLIANQGNGSVRPSVTVTIIRLQ